MHASSDNVNAVAEFNFRVLSVLHDMSTLFWMATSNVRIAPIFTGLLVLSNSHLAWFAFRLTDRKEGNCAYITNMSNVTSMV